LIVVVDVKLACFHVRLVLGTHVFHYPLCGPRRAVVSQVTLGLHPSLCLHSFRRSIDAYGDAASLNLLVGVLALLGAAIAAADVVVDVYALYEAPRHRALFQVVGIMCGRFLGNTTFVILQLFPHYKPTTKIKPSYFSMSHELKY